MSSRIAIVTGASRGIGKAIALRLAKDGLIVIGTATSDAGAAAITTYFEVAGYDSVGRAMNVVESGAIEAFVNKVTEEFEAPLVLVNNAGITRDNLLLRMKDEEWDDILRTNLTSIFRMSRACLRGMMKARHGRIVNITSVVGVAGNAGQTNYAAAKAGIIGFSKSLAKEVGSRGITVNNVAPGFIDTDMTRSLSDEIRQSLLQNIPLGRLGAAEEIAGAVSFLCSDDAAYITGETLHVNGGMHMA